MASLLLRFAINLKRLDINFAEDGPLFFRWLPNEEDDSIILRTNNKNSLLKVWFGRYGFIDSGIIQYSYDKKEVDAEIIPKQAVLQGGPLLGSLEILDLSQTEETVLAENKIGDVQYKELGKKVAKIIQPPVSNFIKILRTNYGQYWIEELDKWDSRKHTIGTYCNIILQLKWSLNNGESWADFIPDQESIPHLFQFSSIETFQEYLTQDEWVELGKMVQTDYEPGLAGAIYTYSRELLDQGNLKHALIEGVNALELALGEYMREKLSASQELIKIIA